MTLAPPRTAPAPAEPTTPIKLSEAIRLGCLTTRQAHGSYLDDILGAPLTWDRADEAVASCAIGAAALGWGIDPELVPSDDGRGRLRCPAGCGDRVAYPVIATVIHLNDDHAWKREAIADWLEGIGR